jgi:hypothetical protein
MWLGSPEAVEETSTLGGHGRYGSTIQGVRSTTDELSYATKRVAEASPSPKRPLVPGAGPGAGQVCVCVCVSPARSPVDGDYGRGGLSYPVIVTRPIDLVRDLWWRPK